jgi:quinol-cytochrome oxidoreductase complex cytochrome b subunit
MNLMIEWLTFLLCIREVPGLDLNLETGYPDWGFLWFSLVPPGKCQDRTLNYATFFPIHHSFITLSFSTIAWVTKKVLNKLLLAVGHKLNIFIFSVFINYALVCTYHAHRTPGEQLSRQVFMLFFSQSFQANAGVLH